MASYLITSPELVQAAAGSLARVGSTINDAAAAAVAPTTALLPAAADEVSAAISQLFGSFGQEFQALSVQALAFHAQFTSLLNGNAEAYLDTEIANAAAGWFGGAGTAAPAASGPLSGWALLASHTETNLGLLVQDFSTRPFPLLTKILQNQWAYLEVIGSAWANAVTSFPAGLQVLPGQLQAAVQSISGFNPLAFATWFATNQSAYAHTFTTSISDALRDFGTTIPVALSDLENSVQQVEVGNFNEAAYWFGKSAIDLWVSGVDTSAVDINALDTTATIQGPVYLLGPAGDLLPLLSIPKLEMQDFTSILPPGSIVQHMAQNSTNLFATIANGDIAVSAGLFVDASGLTQFPPNIATLYNSTYYFNASFGLPIAVGYSLLGGPVNLVSGIANTATQMGAAIDAGDYIGAFGTLLNAPPTILDGFLNGQLIVDLDIPVAGAFPITVPVTPPPPLPPFTITLGGFGFSAPVVLHMPFNGILVPPHPVTATVDTLDMYGDFLGNPFNVSVPLDQTTTIGGTDFGGLVPMLVNTVPRALADSITPYSV